MSQTNARLRRVLEVVYGVDGVAGARVWQWPGHVAVGVLPSPLVGATELIVRVERATAGLRDPDEAWDFGLLDLGETTSPSDAEDHTATRSARRREVR
jgi:hypothetical protein